MRKVILTGPESSGKTTLARQLAGHFKTVWVPEFARTFLQQLDRPYLESDLPLIAKGQWALIAEKAPFARRFLFCDTGMLVLKVWSVYKFGRCHPFILEQLQKHQNDLFILCRPDIPWEPDPLRENPDNREELYDLYRQELQSGGFDFIETGGSPDQRLQKIIQYLTT
ncbi:MAG: ATPase [Bacteroidetes bacterium]|nr:MAG: ATPase [Bacteroidota bacterium]